MSKNIAFYFDFSSPYGYLAACQIDELAARIGCTTSWHPYLMGAAMKRSGRQPLIQHEMLWDYAAHDLQRGARRAAVSYRHPDPFPIATIATGRAHYWFADRDVDQGKAFARAAYSAYFVDGKDISQPETVASVGATLGAGEDELLAALQDPAVKGRLKDETEDAIAKGVFGSPFFLVGDEPFWGNDRLHEVEQWITTGGW